MESQCVFSGSCSAEGVVIRTVRGFPFDQFERHVAKYVRENHIQSDMLESGTFARLYIYY